MCNVKIIISINPKFLVKKQITMYDLQLYFILTHIGWVGAKWDKIELISL